MVFYGPWEDQVVYTEQWTYGSSEEGAPFGLRTHTIDPVPTYAGAALTYAQWRGAGGLDATLGAHMWRTETAEALSVPEGTPPYEEPGFATDAISKEAWGDAAAAGEEVSVEPSLNARRLSLYYEGGIVDQAGPGVTHFERWTAESAEAGIDLTVREGATNWNAIAGVPFNGPEGSLFAEFDPARPTTALLSETASLTVDWSIGGDPRWQMLVKDAGIAGSNWHISDGGRTVTLGRAGSYLGNFGSFAYDAAQVDEWRTEYEASRPAVYDPGGLVPMFAVVWTGGWPGNFLGAGPGEYPVDGASVVVTHTWKAPRWRWVYDQPATTPYRRTFPRDDALAGGAARTWPQAKSLQSSNRTFGSYL